ncbi:fibronectin type III domain protein, partial [Escherichia coli ARS4.2123]
WQRMTAVSGWSARPGRRKPHTASGSWRWGVTR